jgi:hypothetical protein
MNKKYELLQDLPYVKKGAIYEQDGIRYTCNSGEFISDLNADSLSFQSIENNPTWFREVAQEPKIEINSVNRCYTKHNTVYDNDTNMLGITFGFNKMLSEQEMATVKSAIEKTLNTSTPTSELVEDKKDVDWEILESYHDDVNVTHRYIGEHGSYKGGGESCEKQGCNIFSVLRKSDNTVWTIGDEVYYDVYGDKTHFKIDSFKVEKGVVYLYENTCPMTVIEKVHRLPPTTNDKEVKKEPFVWTDKLVMKIVGEAHRDGWEKYTLGLYDRVQEFKELNTNKH